MCLSDPYYTLGVPLPGPEALTAPLVRRALAACDEDRRFTVVELRRLEGEKRADIIVVDCRNDRVPSKNARGIRYVERLALVFPMPATEAPEVRALRADFPATEHQNSVGAGEPASLCLYFEPWVAVVRGWTGRRFLQRIIVWLGDVAAGELHRADQPVEQFYFTSPWELVLPPGVRERGVPESQILVVRRADTNTEHRGMFTGSLQARGTAVNGMATSVLVIDVDPVVGGAIEPPPHNLGAVAQQLERRGSGLLRPLIDSISQLAEGVGLAEAEGERGLLILRVPVRRVAGGEVELHQVMAFLVENGLGGVGAALGILSYNKGQKRYFRALVIGDRYHVEGEAWKPLVVAQIAVLDPLDRALAHRVTGVAPSTADFRGVLIGAGSLGSQIGALWARQAWGQWSVIDPDFLKPHNVPRHQAYRGDIGRHKAFLVARAMAVAGPAEPQPATPILEDILADKPEVHHALEHAALVVDASTTLHVPRALASHDALPRCASVFFTPSGQSAVLLLEDADRRLRLDALEAQYYRAILRSDWGARHLAGHRAREFWIGAGCREVTTLLSPELVAQHGGLLARRLRVLRDDAGAAIRVWEHDEATGAVQAHEIAVAPTLQVDALLWKVRWDEDVRRRVRELRAAALPQETGGVLVGYVDQLARVIQVVDAMPPPADSVRSTEAFERGSEGLAQELARIADRTGGIVGYVGEWHSHPDGVATAPSRADYSQLVYLTDHLRDEGLPALILIVGEDTQRFAVGDVID